MFKEWELRQIADKVRFGVEDLPEVIVEISFKHAYDISLLGAWVVFQTSLDGIVEKGAE